MLARSKSRQLALALLPAPAIAGEPAESVADISAHDAAGLGVLGLTLTEQDQKDVVAYMKLMQ